MNGVSSWSVDGMRGCDATLTKAVKIRACQSDASWSKLFDHEERIKRCQLI